ncbi:MAG: DUF981 domain-containing protein [Arcanobacterium sp.]|nr:DUF981 domain-containing protein [Arcanobacterium sp.]MDY5588585.1 DUF981 family protein [Arcanobacterium sp.]
MLLQGITTNTTMALVAGTIMVLSVLFARAAAKHQGNNVAGFGWAFIALGSYLGLFGLHMAMTWPLAQIDGAFCCKVDNYTFGEPAAFFGILTFIAGIAIVRGDSLALHGVREFDVVRTLRPILYVAAIGGVGLIFIAIGGMHFGMWRPPTVEPVARLMAGQLIEPLIMMTLYMGSGVGALLAPFAPSHKTVAKIATIIIWGIGMLWIFLSFTVFYSHIGFFPQPDGSYI